MPDTPTPAPPKKRRGLFCPRCNGTNLPVECSKLPCRGVRTRYRICADCQCKLVTAESVIRWSYPVPAEVAGQVAAVAAAQAKAVAAKPRKRRAD